MVGSLIQRDWFCFWDLHILEF